MRTFPKIVFAAAVLAASFAPIGVAAQSRQPDNIWSVDSRVVRTVAGPCQANDTDGRTTLRRMLEYNKDGVQVGWFKREDLTCLPRTVAIPAMRALPLHIAMTRWTKGTYLAACEGSLGVVIMPNGSITRSSATCGEIL